MTDFSPMIANPKLVILGAGAHIGIFDRPDRAKVLSFSINESGVIWGDDGHLGAVIERSR
jgi:oxaloacetate decarboxylase beta subunit